MPEAADDPTRPLRSSLRGIASVVAPASLVTGLLYYFGWTRTSIEAHLLGLDDSVLGYSTQDYLLNSLSSMYVPLTVGLVGVIALLASHAGLVVWTGDGAGRRDALLRRILAGVGAVAAVALVVGIVGSRVGDPPRLVSWGAPVAVTVGLALGGYALYARRRFLAPAPAAPPSPELAAVRLAASSLFVVLLLLSAFWSVSHYAGVKGVDLAVLVERDLPDRPDVTLYSGRRLYLQPPVREVELGHDEGSYRFSYSGLKLLFRSGHNYFLRPSDPSASDVNIVIPDSGDVRLELVRPG